MKDGIAFVRRKGRKGFNPLRIGESSMTRWATVNQLPSSLRQFVSIPFESWSHR